MDTQAKIVKILQDRLDAEHVELEDESHAHRHHRGRMHAPAGSGHFNLIVVSPQFAGKTLMQQHRLVYDALAAEMQTTIHALSIRAYTPSQWAEIN
ncbi:BolA family protein [Pseudanabaena sp. PCC 6802]|uniref:BolA family protein n=1 Tax=Pseudanabaena sp. PCC 6802 TaxID=118173 RepID=UPI00034856AF|nr:BolA family protein [Pseudanabaena sp. PCC 6802]